MCASFFQTQAFPPFHIQTARCQRMAPKESPCPPPTLPPHLKRRRLVVTNARAADEEHIGMDEADIQAMYEILVRADAAVIKSKKQVEEALKVLTAEKETITHAKEVILNMIRARSAGQPDQN